MIHIIDKYFEVIQNPSVHNVISPVQKLVTGGKPFNRDSIREALKHVNFKDDECHKGMVSIKSLLTQTAVFADECNEKFWRYMGHRLNILMEISAVSDEQMYGLTADCDYITDLRAYVPKYDTFEMK